jgi:MFS family permease
MGFVDFALITMHVSVNKLISEDLLPLLYAGAMFIDAFSALFFGWLFDKKGVKVLVLSTLISALFSVFIFWFNNLTLTVIGVLLWGVGMGAQESILKSVVTKIVPKSSRSTGFGIFEMCFGVSWFLGSWLIGALYDVSPFLLIVFSVTAQIISVLFFIITAKIDKSDRDKFEKNKSETDKSETDKTQKDKAEENKTEENKTEENKTEENKIN